jgi:hypothetical protein
MELGWNQTTLKSSIGVSVERFTLLGINDLAALPPTEHLVKGALPSSGLAAIYGPSRSGKTFLALDLIMAIACQSGWFGHKVKNSPVTFVGLKGKVVCGHHGGYSTGAKTKEGKDRIRSAHFKHGEKTLETKVKRNSKSVMFRYLTNLGNHCNMFYKELKTRGPPPSGYTQLDLTDPEQLAVAILKTVSIQ